MSIFTKIGSWLSKAFKTLKTDGAKVAIAITEGLQQGLKSGVLTDIADVISGIFPNVKNLPAEIVADLKIWIPKILGAELAIEGLPDNPTEKDILDFENKVITAFGEKDEHSKLWTVLASQVYAIIQKHIGQPKVTFFELAKDVQEAWLDYQADKAAQAGDAS